MSPKPTIDEELFDLAIYFTDQAHGLDDCYREFDHLLDQSAERWSHQNLLNKDYFTSVSNYIHSLAYPSHLSVELLLNHDYIDRAVKQARSLANPQEKCRSIVLLVKHFLKMEMFEEALSLIQDLPEEERKKCISMFVGICIDHDMPMALVAFGSHLDDQQEKMEIYKQAALKLAMKSDVEEALNFLAYLKNSPEYSSIQSNLVRILTERGYLAEAEKLALEIAEKPEREDAYHFIVHELVNVHHETDAIEFIDKMPDPDDKLDSAKVVEKSMLSQRQFQEAASLRQHFELPDIIYKRTA